MLHAQKQYGSTAPKVRDLDRVSFGIRQFRTLPEDVFDRQPLGDETVLCVADVRIDNRKELAADLGLDSAEAQSSADSSLFFAAWRRWGTACFQRINGDFAAAVYSATDQSLTLVRDPLGRRPLHYARSGELIVFASMPTGILALPEFRRGLDLRGMAAGLLEVAQHDPMTIFEGIRRVLPGQVLTFNRDRETSEICWNPSLEPLRLKRQEDYVEVYRDVLDKAVRPRLRRLAGPIASQLSSGLDSSAVAATAARLKNPDEQLVAFTAAPRPEFHSPAPRNRFADESELAALTARMHGMNHVVIRNYSPLPELIKRMPGLYQTPFWNVLNLRWIWNIEDLARQENASIMLSGEAGNLTLQAGGLGILADLIAQGRWKQWWREARLASRRKDIRWRGILFSSFEPKMPRSVVSALERLFRGGGKLEEQSFINRQWLEDPVLKAELDNWRPATGDSYEARLGMLLGADTSAYNKGALAKSGIDFRSPLVDRKLVEFSLRLPRDQLFRDGKSRPLAQEALADRLPPEVLGNTARGYQAADWFEHIDKADLHELVEEIEPNATVHELIDLPRIRRAVDQWPSGGFHKFEVFHPLGSELPLALASGYFVLQAEKWLAGRFD
jgi:asparagine synthase (glutamine-hydrolysing)